MAYGDFKDLLKRTSSGKLLRNKAFNIAKNPKYDGYQRGLVSMIYKFFDKMSNGSGITMLQNKQLTGESHKPIIQKLKGRKLYSSFKDNIWGADLSEMQLISKTRLLLCVVGIFSDVWVLALKDKKDVTIVNVFQKVSNKSDRKPIKTWVDKGSEFYNRLMKSSLEKNDIGMHSTHNEGKSFIAERFITTLKNKIYKYMTPISKNVYIEKLNDLVNEYSNTYHRTVKMKPLDVKNNIFTKK